jgi:hypothetical protein
MWLALDAFSGAIGAKVGVFVLLVGAMFAGVICSGEVVGLWVRLGDRCYDAGGDMERLPGSGCLYFFYF